MPSAGNSRPAAFNGWTGQAKKGGTDKPPGPSRKCPQGFPLALAPGSAVSPGQKTPANEPGLRKLVRVWSAERRLSAIASGEHTPSQGVSSGRAGRSRSACATRSCISRRSTPPQLLEGKGQEGRRPPRRSKNRAAERWLIRVTAENLNFCLSFKTRLVNVALRFKRPYKPLTAAPQNCASRGEPKWRNPAAH